jgi:hypothetical protein
MVYSAFFKQIAGIVLLLSLAACSGGFYIPPTLLPVLPTQSGEHQLTGGIGNRGAVVQYSKAFSRSGVFYLSAQSGIKNGFEESPFVGSVLGIPSTLPNQSNLRHFEAGLGRFQVSGDEFKWISSFQFGGGISDIKSFWPDSSGYDAIFKGRKSMIFGQYHVSLVQELFEISFSQRLFWGRFWDVNSVDNFYNTKYRKDIWGTDVSGTLGLGQSWFRPYISGGIYLPFKGASLVNPFMIFNGSIGIMVRFNDGPFAPRKKTGTR